MRLDAIEGLRAAHPVALALGKVRTLDREAAQAVSLGVADIQAEHDHIGAGDGVDGQPALRDALAHGGPAERPDLLFHRGRERDLTELGSLFDAYLRTDELDVLPLFSERGRAR